MIGELKPSLNADLAEDFRLATLARRTKMEIYKLYAIRILVNLIVLGLLGVSAYLIFIASQLSVTVRNSEMMNCHEHKSWPMSMLIACSSQSIR